LFTGWVRQLPQAVRGFQRLKALFGDHQFRSFGAVQFAVMHPASNTVIHN